MSLSNEIRKLSEKIKILFDVNKIISIIDSKDVQEILEKIIDEIISKEKIGKKVAYDVYFYDLAKEILGKGKTLDKFIK